MYIYCPQKKYVNASLRRYRESKIVLIDKNRRKNCPHTKFNEIRERDRNAQPFLGAFYGNEQNLSARISHGIKELYYYKGVNDFLRCFQKFIALYITR